MVKILGIDPGSRITGYGFINVNGNHHEYIASGCIKVSAAHWPDRLALIYQELHQLIIEIKPDESAIEEVFVQKNVNSALKLGQARGAAIVACACNGLPVAEYAARAIKKSVVGYGGADKLQVQQMIKTLLNLSKSPQADAADALAVALCHAHARSWQGKLEELV